MTLTKKWRGLQMKDTQKKSTGKKMRFLTLTEVFVNQKRVNVCEYTVKMAPHDSLE